MALKAGKPTTAKERAIEAMKQVDDESPSNAAVKTKTKRFNADIPEELHRAMKTQSAQEGITLNELAIRIFNEYLSKVSKK